MSILKNLFAAVGAVTIGAVATGAVLGAMAAKVSKEDDFDFDEPCDDTPCDGCCKCSGKDADYEDEDDHEDKVNEDNEDEPIIFVHVVPVPCSAPDEKDEDGKKAAPNADEEKPAEKTEEESDEEAKKPENPSETKGDKTKK